MAPSVSHGVCNVYLDCAISGSAVMSIGLAMTGKVEFKDTARPAKLHVTHLRLSEKMNVFSIWRSESCIFVKLLLEYLNLRRQGEV